MKLIRKLFDLYVRILKIITTTIGITLIYLTAIPIGKILYLFSQKKTDQHWNSYQPGSSPSKMY